MKKLLIVLLGMAVLSVPASSLAGVSGSPHDMSAYGGSGSPTEELCFGCHIPHGALGDKLWSMDTTGAVAGMLTFERLCYSCHDGTIATLYDVFDKADGLTDHTLVGTDCSGTGACHDVHEQPVVDGNFLAEGIGANGSGCENCHDATLFAGAPAGDHTAAGNHPLGASANGLGCEDCHGAHTGVTQGDGTNDAYILRADNEPTGGAYGNACVLCHNNQAPFVGIVGEVFNYAELQTNGTEAKHPTYGGTFSLTGCNECHDVHSSTDNGYLLNVAHHDAATDMCITCHTSAGNGAPGVGDATHYTGDISSWPGSNDATENPWAEEIDDDGTVGPDWTSATTDLMACETCHSVHKNGNAGYFTRILQTDQNELCTTHCHDAN
jgi:predicted CXXCH cytochrome family protein